LPEKLAAGRAAWLRVGWTADTGSPVACSPLDSVPDLMGTAALATPPQPGVCGALAVLDMGCAIVLCWVTIGLVGVQKLHDLLAVVDPGEHSNPFADSPGLKFGVPDVGRYSAAGSLAGQRCTCKSWRGASVMG
jgi:hypothetical protein